MQRDQLYAPVTVCGRPDGAEIDCRNGLYEKGIATMEKLLRDKKFAPPPPGPDENEDDV